MAMKNIQVYGALNSYLSKSFTERIPDITEANINQLADAITQYPTMANEFVDVLTNQVIRTMFMTRVMDNPLSIFEKGDLEKFGKSLELIYVDLITGKDFTERFGSSYENEYLAPSPVTNVKVQYLTENSRLKYKVTISTDMLASAFKSEYGLSTLTNQIVSKMVESYNVDKFLMTWKLIDVMKKKEIEGPNGLATDTDGKELLRVIKKVIKDMRFPSTKFNESGVWTKSNPEDLVIIMDTRTTSFLDINVLASAFNVSKMDMASRIIEVPYFNDNTTHAIICDRDKIQIYNTKMASDTVKNGAGLFTNVFLHRWDLLGACDFANCVRIKSATPIANADKYSIDGKKQMPYDVIKFDVKDDNGTVMADLTETELEIGENGEIKAKREKKVKK